MWDKLTIVLIVAGGLLLAGLSGTIVVLKSRNDALTAQKALLDRQLAEAKGDLQVSANNHNRLMAEKDEVITALIAQADAQREASAQFARITKDIANAEDNKLCIQSPPIRAMLGGLTRMRRAPGTTRGDQPPHDRVQAR